MKKIIVMILALVSISSCNDDDSGRKNGNVTLDVNNIINNEAVVLNTGSYMNKSNESYNIKELKYIVSNLVFIKENGEEYKYPVGDSYFVVNEEVELSKKISLSRVAVGEYTKVRFGIGVDQSKYPLNKVNNFIPTAQENGMLWPWSAGYKFLKFEGEFVAEGRVGKKFAFHIGSHGQAQDNYREVTLELPEKLIIIEEGVSTMQINADINKILNGNYIHSLVVKSDIQVDPVNAPKIMDNVSTMFSVVKVSN